MQKNHLKSSSRTEMNKKTRLPSAVFPFSTSCLGGATLRNTERSRTKIWIYKRPIIGPFWGHCFTSLIRDRGATLRRGAGGGGWYVTQSVGLKNTFFSVTLYNFHKSPLPPRSLLWGHKLLIQMFKFSKFLSFKLCDADTWPVSQSTIIGY